MNLIVPFLFLFSPNVLSQKIFTPDTSINKVALMSKVSFEKKFSDYTLPKFYEADHPPKLEFINADKTKNLQYFIVTEVIKMKYVRLGSALEKNLTLYHFTDLI